MGNTGARGRMDTRQSHPFSNTGGRLATSPPETPAGLDELTQRQREVGSYLADGLTRAAIAQRLSLSIHTVHEHERHIFEKLGCRCRSHVAAVVVRAGLDQRAAK